MHSQYLRSDRIKKAKAVDLEPFLDYIKQLNCFTKDLSVRLQKSQQLEKFQGKQTAPFKCSNFQATCKGSK